MDATCKTCPHYALLQPDANYGHCRRSSPGLGDNGRATYPPAYDTGWCGGHPLRQRDRLAAMMAQGILANGQANGPRMMAEDAYAAADALLALARPEGGKGDDRG